MRFIPSEIQQQQQQQQQHSLGSTTTTEAKVWNGQTTNRWAYVGLGAQKQQQREEGDGDADSTGTNNWGHNGGRGRALIRLIKRHIRLGAMRRNGITTSTFICHTQRQVFYAQCAKLVALFAVAVAHLLFLHPFLDLFSRLEKYASHLDFGSADAALIRQCVHDLAEYKKNVWMTVAVLCVGLSTSSFFLFLLPSSASPVRKCHIYLIGLVDLVSFGCLPALFLARMTIMRRVQSELGIALEQAHRLNSAEALMNEIKCTIHPREQLPFCSELILRALITNDLVKFLLVLCALTLAYLTVAYLIYWCIKHWIPHSFLSSPLCHHSFAGAVANGKLCPCLSSQLIVVSSSSSSSDRRKKRLKGGAIGYSPLGGVPSRRSSASSTAPIAFSPPLTTAQPLALVMHANPLTTAMAPSAQCSPVSTSASSVVVPDEEQIPAEPTMPPHMAHAKQQTEPTQAK